MSAKFPVLEAYLNRDGSFDRGVNFAVSATTALFTGDPGTKSLSEQLEWMFSYFNRTCGLDKG
ncbi:acetylajmalan esterase-like protein [Corchorus olitorius]|uniref:Acetylajmalan esterase-like protein n=1 Tax=Corchorus olitorius TaxID=93759 RepID=A0A1R3ITU0_9ROSI|nr:acetylajmalan esterase-like protein [Corchorus olitorius]